MFETGRAQSELFTFQCSQWELIWNIQLIGRYDRYEEKSVLLGNTYDIPPSSTLPQQLQLTFLRFKLQPGNTADWPPPHIILSTLSVLRNIQRCIVMQISLLVYIYIYIYIQIPKTDMWKSQFYQGTLTIYPPPPLAYCQAQLQLTFLRFQVQPGNTADWPPPVPYCQDNYS